VFQHNLTSLVATALNAPMSIISRRLRLGPCVAVSFDWSARCRIAPLSKLEKRPQRQSKSAYDPAHHALFAITAGDRSLKILGSSMQSLWLREIFHIPMPEGLVARRGYFNEVKSR
jgi:hypothetical protein